MSDKKISDEDIGVIDIILTLIPFKRVIILSTVILSIISIIYSLILTPIYHSKVVMFPLDDQSNQSPLSGMTASLGGLASLAGISNDGNSLKVDNAIAILKSRTFIQSFIADQDIMPILFPDNWESEEPPSFWLAYEKFERLMDISKDPKTGIIEVSFSWNDPKIAAQWANNIIDKLNNHLKITAIEESERSVAYLEQQLPKTSLKAAELVLYSLIETETRKIMVANSREQYLFKIIDKAIPAERRTSPVRRVIVMVGTILGFFIGIIIALVTIVYKNYNRDKVIT